MFKPSQMQLLTGTVLGLLYVSGIIYTIFFSSPEVRQYFDYQAENPSGIYASYQEASDSVNESEFAADASIFIFWSTVGLLSYVAALAFIRLLKDVSTFEREITSKHTNKNVLVREASLRIVIRFVGIVSLYVLMTTIVQYVFPFFLISGQSARDSLAILGGYMLVAFIVSLLFSYLVTIIMRIILLRPRVFKIY